MPYKGSINTCIQVVYTTVGTDIGKIWMRRCDAGTWDSWALVAGEEMEKAAGTDINTGTDDAKFVTAKAIEDSNLIRSTDNSVTDIRELTKAEYDALPQIDKDNNTYFITDDLDCSFDITYIFDKVYPINTGFIAYDDTDYTNHLGFTWEKTCIGRVPVGKDITQTEFDTIGKTGGHKKLQAHDHGMVYSPNSSGDAQSRLPYVLNAGGATDSTGGRGWTNMSTLVTGEGNAENLQPYQVVNYWKRVL